MLISGFSAHDFCDLVFTDAHADGHLDESVGNSLVVSEFHDFIGDFETEFLAKIGDFFKVGFSGESAGHSFERRLGVHEALELSGGVV